MKYLSAKGISENYDFCMKTARTLIAEIREEISRGRYPPESILEGCGVRVSEKALLDLLMYRKALKDPIARGYVPSFYVGYE